MDDKSSPDENQRFWKRLIDDIIAAFVGTQQEAAEFVEWMNTLWPGLKFTSNWSNKEMVYLDVKIVITEEGQIETDRHIKPTNPQLYLPYKSNHPASCFKSIVYGQAITVRMICSREEDVERHMKILQQKFEERGYPSQMVSQYLQKGIRRERADLLKPKPQYPHHMVPTPMSTKVPFKPTFVIT